MRRIARVRMLAPFSSRAALLGAALIGLSLGAFAGCRSSDQIAHSGCQADSDCGTPGAAWRCDTQNGACYCRTDAACPASQFCNTAGYCQDRAGCTQDSDCVDPSLFCDTSTGTCLGPGRCTSDLHCALGQVCDFAKTTCVDGCRSGGDCQAGACRCGDEACKCNGLTAAELEQCQIGVCDPYFCADDSTCRYGELCGTPPDGGSSSGSSGTGTGSECYSDYSPTRRPYCDRCTYGGGLQTCGRGANYCLVDTAHAGNYYCGADCSSGQACPRGYACQDVIVVYGREVCTSAATCQGKPSLPCTQDSECRFGGHCVIPSGQTAGSCAGSCAISEGDVEGFCSCQLDEDCPQETCSAGECSISRHACVNDSDCHSIHCVDFHGSGGCLIGQNCAPSDGLSCLEAAPAH